MPVTLTVAAIHPDEHLAFVNSACGSFLQTPAWADVKADWQHLNLGWFEGNRLVGTGLVLLRKTPRVSRFLAYLPEGPVFVDWAERSVDEVTAPLLHFLKSRRVFAVKMGPQIIARRWTAKTLKQAMAEGVVQRVSEVAPDETSTVATRWVDGLQAAGWQREEGHGAGFGDLQPRYVFQVPLAGRSVDEVFAGFNQLWRRNVRKAEKSEVEVSRGSYEDLAAFHDVYTVTAERDGFNPRPLSYFHRMWRAMQAEDADRIRLYLAKHEGEVLAATTWVRVGRHVWYSYGASTNHKREMRASNAVQWQMIVDAHEAGADVYDLRGISDTLDEQDPLFGLIRFKLGTGGEAIEYIGEWDYPLRPLLYRAFQYYMARR